MNQLGKNLALSLCVVATLLVIVGLKHKFAADGKSPLLSQPSEDRTTTALGPTRSSPRPRVLQAKPLTQHDRAILSPTHSQYADSETDYSVTGGHQVMPIPNPSPATSPRPLSPPGLVTVERATTSPIIDSIGEQMPEVTPRSETPTVPVAAQPLPEFVVTGAEDSFWTISERVYGSGAYYRALFRHNEAKVLRPDQLRAGVEVRTPSLEVLQELYPADFPQGPAFTP
jgi:hypothetical protein